MEIAKILTFFILPILLVILTHFLYRFHHSKKCNALGSPTSKEDLPPLGNRNNDLRATKPPTKLTEDKYEAKWRKHQQSLQQLSQDQTQKQGNERGSKSHHTSPSSSPRNSYHPLAARPNCSCSPTTHAGSFRCRIHRNGSNMRRGHSVGSNLSDLASKSNLQINDG